jgi:hypothetical protein
MCNGEGIFSFFSNATRRVESGGALRARASAYVINLAVQAFLFMDSKEAVEAACLQIEELDTAVYDIDMIEGWRKKRILGWHEIGPLSKVYNICIYIRANDYRYNLF